MKILGFFSLVLLGLFVFAPIPSTQADDTEPFASGSVKLSLPDGTTRRVEFAAKLHQDGSTSGQMTFSGPIEILEQNANDVNPDDQEMGTMLINASPQFYFKAAFDCMIVKGSRAVMSGTVTESNGDRYVGQRVILVVQDGGEDIKSSSTDKLTWGLYNPLAISWVPSDAEVENDKGVGTSWVASDGERDDDVGKPSETNKGIGCQSFPPSSFSLLKVRKGDGDIEVRP